MLLRAGAASAAGACAPCAGTGRAFLPAGAGRCSAPGRAGRRRSDPRRAPAPPALGRRRARDAARARRACRPWRSLLGALRTLEARGEIRGGRFVAGLVGEQFALPEAVETLRAIRRRTEEPEDVIVNAADPLNLVGILLPGAARIAAGGARGDRVRDGVPVESGELGTVLSRLGRRASAASHSA
jgi:hypothetical protein